MKLSIAFVAQVVVALVVSCMVVQASGASVGTEERVVMEADLHPLLLAQPEARSSTWKRVGPVASATLLQFSFALTPRNADALETMFWEVSDPTSPKYTQYWSLDKVRALVAPSEADVETVMDFVTSAGATRATLLASGDTLDVVMPAGRAAAAFQCGAFLEFHDSATDNTLYRATEHYSLPASVARVVDFVGGVTRLPRTKFAATTRFQHREAAADELVEVSNAPAVFHIGGGNVSVLAMPRCADGTPATDLAECDIISLNVRAAPQLSVGSVSEMTLTNLPQICKPCSQLTGNFWEYSLIEICSAMAKNAGVSTTDTLFCAATLPSVTVAVKTSLEVQFGYATGAWSAKNSTTASFMPYVTPAFLDKMYTIPSSLEGGDESNLQAVAEFLGQYYSPTDLEQYLGEFGLPVEHIAKVVGPNNASDPGLEANLDVQVMLSIARNIPTQFWSTSGLRNNSAPSSNSNQEPFYRWVVELGSTDVAPWVTSVSYDDDEPSMPLAFTNRLNFEFMKAGVRGLTLLFCAGDDGVGGITVRQGDTECPVFVPAFPAASPYVVAVGGSEMGRNPPTNEELSEVVSNSATGSIITTGGGFSTRYGAPEYQCDAIAEYLKSPMANLPPSKYYNASGRGYPDVTGMATNYEVAIKGKWWLIGGTSASTPLVAAMMSLLNDIRLKNGAAPLGFVNPLIYQLHTKAPGAFFNDVVYGVNKCSAIPTRCCEYGFSAAPGWDPTSGVGSPKFEALWQLLSSTTEGL